MVFFINTIKQSFGDFMADKYYFKYKDYDLAKAYFEDGNTIYCDDLGPFGGKRGEVISFDASDVELDEDDAEENGYTAEDLDRPVVFDRNVSQLSTNTIEWDSTIGDLWCWEDELAAFKKDHPEFFTEEDKINEIVKMIRDNHIDPKKIMDKLNEKVDESLKESVENMEQDIYLTKAVNVFLKDNPGWLEDFTKEELIEVFSMRDDLNDYIADHVPPSVFAEEMEDLDLFQNCSEKAGF